MYEEDEITKKNSPHSFLKSTIYIVISAIYLICVIMLIAKNNQLEKDITKLEVSRYVLIEKGNLIIGQDLQIIEWNDDTNEFTQDDVKTYGGLQFLLSSKDLFVKTKNPLDLLIIK